MEKQPWEIVEPTKASRASGFRMGLGSRIYSLRFRVEGLGLRVYVEVWESLYGLHLGSMKARIR